MPLENKQLIPLDSEQTLASAYVAENEPSAVEEIPPSVLAISNLRCPSPPPILTNSSSANIRQNPPKAPSTVTTPAQNNNQPQRETIPAGGALLQEKGSKASEDNATSQLATPSPVVAGNNVLKLTNDYSTDYVANPPQTSQHHKSPSVHAHFYIDETVKGGKIRSRSASNSGSELGTNGAPFNAPHIPNSTSTKIRTPELLDADKFAPIGNIDLALSNASITGSDGGISSNVSPRVKPPALKDSLSPVIGQGEQNANIDPRLPQDDGKFHVLLGVCGALSTVKIKLIIGKLIEVYGDKISIQLILTSASEHFISQETLHHLEQAKKVRIWRDADEWQTWKGRLDPVLHIELRRWADILIVSPLTANTLSKIALGLCDNLLTNVIRAWNTSYPILLAPAMVSYAYNAITTKRQLRLILEEMPWIEILKPVEKVVGSYGDIGMGGMMDYNEVVNKIVLKLGGYPDDDDDDDDDDDEEIDQSNSEAIDDDDEDDDDDDDEDDDDDDDDEDEVVGNNYSENKEPTKGDKKAAEKFSEGLSPRSTAI